MNHSEKDVINARRALINNAKRSIDTFQDIYASHHVNVYRKSMFWRFIQRRQTVRSLHKLHDLMVVSSIFLHEYRHLQPGDDFKEIMKYHYDYLTKLANCKELVMKGLNYNKQTDTFSEKNGQDAWEKITKGLVLPEIKQIGVRG